MDQMKQLGWKMTPAQLTDLNRALVANHIDSPARI
jgi:hypothetical protein